MMLVFWLGRVEYTSCWRLQRELSDLRAEGRIGDVLLLLEHPPTITLGRSAKQTHLLASPDQLARMGVAVHAIDRGGDVTYHGPGQLVGYPVFHLADHRRDLHWFLRQIEEALIRALAALGVSGRRFPPHTGVWVADEKIAAIGVKISRWVSTHGFALNVHPDIRHFDLIVPCGIREYGVTSLNGVTGRSFTLENVIPPVVRAFAELFPSPRTDADLPPALLSGPSRSLLQSAAPVALKQPVEA
jgi:lipoate-protein ligase B